MKKILAAIILMTAILPLSAATTPDSVTLTHPYSTIDQFTRSARPVPEVPGTLHSIRESVEFDAGNFHLSGTLTRPEGAGPFPAVVFVHDNSRMSRDGYGLYEPIWQRFIESGFACLSWDSPGIGESRGTFEAAGELGQRANIVQQALRFLQSRNDIDAKRIGFWGVGKAGYVMTLAASGSPEVAFIIAVSCPGTNPIDYTAYRLAAEMKHAGLTDVAARTYAWYYKRQETASTYGDYLEYAQTLYHQPVARKILGLDSLLRPEAFIPVEQDPDKSLEMGKLLEKVAVPVLAVFGSRDGQLDVSDAIWTFRSALRRGGNNRLTVARIPGADHMILESFTGGMREMRDNILSGTYRYAPGYLRAMENWLAGLKRQWNR